MYMPSRFVSGLLLMLLLCSLVSCYHYGDLWPLKKTAEQEEFQVFEDPEGEIGDALVREMRLYRDTDGYISYSGAETDVVIMDENGLNEANPPHNNRSLDDPRYGTCSIRVQQL